MVLSTREWKYTYYFHASSFDSVQTGSSLFRSLLAFPDADGSALDATTHDFSKIPHIERLCHILVDASLCGSEVSTYHSRLLTLLF